MRRALAVLLALALSSCAPRLQPRLPEGEVYLSPLAPTRPLAAGLRERLERDWQRILAGEAREVEADLRKLAVKHPGSSEVGTLLAYAGLRAGRLEAAAAGFAEVLRREPGFAPALAGAGSAAFRLGQPEEALVQFQAALAASPSESALASRVEQLRLQVTERRLAAARVALEAGERDSAVEQYRQALAVAPEVSGLRLELAEVLAAGGDLAGAAGVLQGDPRPERAVLLRLGDVLGRLGQPARALDAYRQVLAVYGADAEALAGAARAQEALEMARQPEEYRAIRQASRISRADLAALLAVKVTALARAPRGTPPVAVDISGSWARGYILEALSRGLLDVYPNHTFQPGATVRRGDLALALQRVLDALGAPGHGTPALITDMSPGNLLHYPAARVTGAGLMGLTPQGAFEAWRPVSGEEATRTIDALVRLVGR